MSAIDCTDDGCSAPKKRKFMSEKSLLHLFVDYIASQESDPPTQEEILKCVKNLQHRTIDQMTPFQTVVRKKLNLLLPILLACKGDVNYEDSRGQTILHIFVLHYTDKSINPQIDPSLDKQIVEALLERGASVDVTDVTENTPVHYAAANRRTDLVQLMLANFTNVDALNNQGSTVLHHLVAAYNESPNDFDIETIRLLVSKGADYHRETTADFAYSPFFIATSCGLIRVLEIFKMHGADCENLLLHISSLVRRESKHPEEWQHLDRLVNLAESVNSQINEHNLTPLHYVSQHGRLDLVEMFVNAGAEIDAMTIDGVRPLHLAVMEGHLEVAKFLIERGADLRARDVIFDFGLMHMATFKGNKDIMNLLVECGLDVEDEGKDGLRPLHCAALTGRDWAIKLLIRHGVNVNCRTREKQLTALHLIANRQKYGVLKGIVDEYYGSITSLEERIERRFSLVDEELTLSSINSKETSQTCVNLLFQAGANVNARNSQLETPLHVAVTNFGRLSDSEGMLLTLLKYGARVDVHDASQRSPLAINCYHGLLLNYGLAELIAYGADINDIGSFSIENPLLRSYTMRQHLKLVRAIGLPITDKHERSLLAVKQMMIHDDTDESSEDETTDMDLEIAKLMTYYLADGQISLYDFLHMDSKQRCEFAESVLSLDLQSEFPIYRIVIENSCRRAMNEKSIFNLASSALNKLVRFAIPDVCARIIFDYTSMPEMTAFIDAVESLNL